MTRLQSRARERARETLIYCPHHILRALHHEPGQVSLHTDHLDVHQVPGNCLQDLQIIFKYFLLKSSFLHLKFGPLNIKDEPVYSGMAYCSQQCIQGDTLHRMKDVMHSVQIKRFRNNAMWRSHPSQQIVDLYLWPDKESLLNPASEVSGVLPNLYYFQPPPSAFKSAKKPPLLRGEQSEP